MTKADIAEVVECFAQAARRAREAGADGIEIHGCNGYLITQFLSSAINDRTDEYGGSLENRARFALDIVRAIRSEVGDDYHLQFKISAVEYNDELFPWQRAGNTLAESVQVCRWLEEAGVDGFHVSSGASFPHPRNPAGTFPIDLLGPFQILDALHKGRRKMGRVIHWADDIDILREKFNILPVPSVDPAPAIESVEIGTEWDL
jgi:2,4-dienoyl-CoA reductase (NADPH2)